MTREDKIIARDSKIRNRLSVILLYCTTHLILVYLQFPFEGSRLEFASTPNPSAAMATNIELRILESIWSCLLQKLFLVQEIIILIFC